jgi:hypothetical protein
MASLEELRAQLFTFKMRCHEYEQRLAQVNLHGASGATLQRAHGELAERVAWLERERAATASAARLLEEEASGLREVLVKSRGAIETLTDSNVRLKVALASGEEARSALASELAPLRAAAAQGALDGVTLCAARRELADARVAAAAAEERAAREPALLAELAAAHAGAAAAERARSSERAAREAEGAAAREAAERWERRRQEEKLSFEQAARKLDTDVEALRRTIEVKNELIERSAGELATARRSEDARLAELAQYRGELAQSKARGSLAEQDQRRAAAAEHEVAELRARLHEERAGAEKKQADCWAIIGKKEQEIAELEARLKEAKARGKEREAELCGKVSALEAESEHIKTKWKSSLASRRNPAPADAAKENVCLLGKSATSSGKTAPEGGAGSGASSAFKKSSVGASAAALAAHRALKPCAGASKALADKPSFR